MGGYELLNEWWGDGAWDAKCATTSAIKTEGMTQNILTTVQES